MGKFSGYYHQKCLPNLDLLPLSETEREFIYLNAAWISPSGEIFPCSPSGHAYVLFEEPKLHNVIPWLLDGHNCVEALCNALPRSCESIDIRDLLTSPMTANLYDALYYLGWVRLAISNYKNDVDTYELSGRADMLNRPRPFLKRLFDSVILAKPDTVIAVVNAITPTSNEALTWNPKKIYLETCIKHNIPIDPSFHTS